MTEEEFKQLADKVSADTATPEEQLAFMEEVKATVNGMREDIEASNSNN